MNSVLRLEAARRLLDDGRPARAWRLLAQPVPAIFSGQADFLRAESRRAQGFFTEALVLYRRALKGLDADLRVEAYLGSVRALRSLGRTKEASGFLALARGAGLPQYRQAIALEDALLDRAAERYGLSLRKFSALLAGSRKDLAKTGFLLWASGGARRFMGDLAGSRRDFLASLAAFRRAQDREGAGYALFGLGGVSRILGSLDDSRKYYLAAAGNFDGGDDLFGQAYAHCGLANVLRQLGELRSAQAHYLKSWGLYRRLGDFVDLAYVDWGLGKVALHQGRLPEAERLFKRALAAFSKHGETRGVVLSEMALAQALHSRGRTAAAETLFARAYARAKKTATHTHLEVFT